jgi:thiol-disulfide isomerase/thioredoxin
MQRRTFLQGVGIAALGAAPCAPEPALASAASPSPAPSTSPTPFPWDMCAQSAALPYDHPLGLKMRVLDGPDLDLVSYRGKAVLLNIFATWCGPCNNEMPYVVEAATEFADRGLVVVGIDAREPDDTVRAFRKKYGITFPIAMDHNGGFVRALEAGRSSDTVAYPVSLFIDPSGYLYCVQNGAMSRYELRYRIDHFLAESFASPSPSPTPTA